MRCRVLVLCLVYTCLPGMLYAQESGKCFGLGGTGYLKHLEPLNVGHTVGKEHAYFLWSLEHRLLSHLTSLI